MVGRRGRGKGCPGFAFEIYGHLASAAAAKLGPSNSSSNSETLHSKVNPVKSETNSEVYSVYCSGKRKRQA